MLCSAIVKGCIEHESKKVSQKPFKNCGTGDLLLVN